MSKKKPNSKQESCTECGKRMITMTYIQRFFSKNNPSHRTSNKVFSPIKICPRSDLHKNKKDKLLILDSNLDISFKIGTHLIALKH